MASENRKPVSLSVDLWKALKHRQNVEYERTGIEPSYNDMIVEAWRLYTSSQTRNELVPQEKASATDPAAGERAGSPLLTALHTLRKRNPALAQCLELAIFAGAQEGNDDQKDEPICDVEAEVETALQEVQRALSAASKNPVRKGKAAKGRERSFAPPLEGASTIHRAG